MDTKWMRNKEPQTASQLSDEHERLERWFVELTERAASGDSRECDAVWGDFARQLESHLLFEEKEVFPVYERQGPLAAALVRGLRKEHDAIRKQLDQLGVALQLHLTRAETIGRFLTLLRVHTRRERQTIYSWLAASAGRPALCSLTAQAHSRQIAEAPSSLR
jgi:hemerythrin-like domain-containing protein